MIFADPPYFLSNNGLTIKNGKIQSVNKGKWDKETEQIIWARKNAKVPHYFNYKLMKKINNGKQMKDVWSLPAIAKWEKSCGKHPTQKPLSVLTRIIFSSTKQGAWILDPFTGSSTTGIAANLFKRKFLGIDIEPEYLEISKNRKLEIENEIIFNNYRKKLK